MISVGIVAVFACPEGFSLSSNQHTYTPWSESVAVNYLRIFVPGMSTSHFQNLVVVIAQLPKNVTRVLPW